MEIRIVGNYTEPRTWGVYRVEHERGSPTYHLGNHPVRQRELESEFGNAQLLKLHLDRQSALEHRRSLSR
jgi:hypothetical protein